MPCSSASYQPLQTREDNDYLIKPAANGGAADAFIQIPLKNKQHASINGANSHGGIQRGHKWRIRNSKNVGATAAGLKSRYIIILAILISISLCFIIWVAGKAQDDESAAAIAISFTEAQNAKVLNESLIVCSENFLDARTFVGDRPRRDYDHLPTIYFVTPTYPRGEQAAELTRLAHTLLHVPRLHWILANDLPTCNYYLTDTLNKFGIPFTHLSSPMPDIFRKKKPLPRGVANRRAALTWLRHRNVTSGVLYFGDDDNTYDLKLFKEIRTTKRVSMFPVGLIEQYLISGPVVRHGKVVGFLDSWVADRRWPVDMAGFAVNLAYLAEYPNASMPYKPGYEEDYFLRSISLHMDLIEPKGANCTEVLVWHTQTKNHSKTTVRLNHKYLDERSNLGALFKNLAYMGVSEVSPSVGKVAIISKNGKAKPLDYFLS